MNRSLTVVLGLLCCSCTDAPRGSGDVERLRAHLERVERELWAGPELELTANQSTARASALENLSSYIEAEAFPVNDRHDRMTPIFIDAFGNRCAMAALIEASGHGELVQRIARDHNLAYIDDLGGDRELRAWLDASGLTLDEAARIQPSYTPPPDSMTWEWTAGVVASVLSGNTSAASFGVRVGAHGVATNLGDACDHCVYRSMAFMLEGLRTSLGDAGATNQLAALVQYGLHGDPRTELYLLGGPQLSLDDNDDPGTAYGGKLALGYSVKLIPKTWLFAELSASARHQPRGARAQAGLEFGMRW